MRGRGSGSGKSKRRCSEGRKIGGSAAVPSRRRRWLALANLSHTKLKLKSKSKPKFKLKLKLNLKPFPETKIYRIRIQSIYPSSIYISTSNNESKSISSSYIDRHQYQLAGTSLEFRNSRLLAKLLVFYVSKQVLLTHNCILFRFATIC